MKHHRGFVWGALTMMTLVVHVGTVLAQSQTPGQVTKFDPSLNVVDSGITEDAVGNIGIGTTTPAAKLDVVGGNVNLENSSVAAGNVLKGGVLFMHNLGRENTFLGSNAGNLATFGLGRNTAIGYEALENNTYGWWNTATGAMALENNIAGFSNTASGVLALHNNTYGWSNTAIGVEAMVSNTTGYYNTAIGGSALDANISGRENTGTGIQALWKNDRGDQNTANGVAALSSNRTGSLNTASGLAALIHSNGSYNTAYGAAALRDNVSGTYNTALGYDANVSAGDFTNATAIGARAVVDANNKIRLGDTTVAVIEGQVPYTFTSDRNQKENFQPVDGEAVLRKLGGLSLTSWNYIGHDPHQFRHYGPVAQEFFAAFGHDGVGTAGTPTTINSGDLEGILMSAVQALEKRTIELDKRMAENAELRGRIEALERLVKEATSAAR